MGWTEHSVCVSQAVAPSPKKILRHSIASIEVLASLVITLSRCGELLCLIQLSGVICSTADGRND